jgi:diguanylate cyclase (GGDEF)-like protein
MAFLAALVIFGCACAADARADVSPERWNAFAAPIFRHYDPENGLPNPIATAFAEDGAGFLWVGTQGGVGRWDGYSFRTYKSVAGQSGALPDNGITCLHTDVRGRLWIGTGAGGLAMYDAERDQFKVYTAGAAGGLSSVHVSAIADDGSDGLWVGTAGGLDHLYPETGQVYHVHHVAADAASLPDDRIMSLLRDRAGTLWVGTRDGLVKRRRGSLRFEPVSFGPRFAQPMEVANLMEDAGGRIWIGTTKLGAFVLAPLDAMPRAVIETGGTSNLQREWIYALVAAGPHEIWLGTYGQGIVAVDTETGVTRRIRHDPQGPHSLSDDTIWALYRDRAGAIWAATTVGVSTISTGPDAVLTVSVRTPQQPGVRGNDVTSVLAASDGSVWAGLQSKGIDILDPSSARMGYIASNPATPARALPDTFVLAMAEWPDGGVYIGTNRGLYHSTLTGRAVTRLTLPGRDPAARNSALLAHSGTLWIAGTDDGLWAMLPGRLGKSSVEHFDGGQLTDTRGTALAAGASGDLWIGTNYGLNRLDLVSRRIERITPEAANPEALATGYISSLLLDRTGRLWVGTSGGGIQVLVGRRAGKPVFRRLGTVQGLPDDNVDSLLADARGRIWVATDSGIAVVDPHSFAIHALHRADGVAIAAYWSGSAAVTQAGELVFGGIGGMTVIRPDRFRVWDYRPPIVATEIRVGGQLQAPSHGNGEGDGDSGSAPLLVQPHANRLAVQFSALDYTAPELNRYAYRLEGYDRDWIDTDAIRRLAVYSNLPPGDYVLSLRGSNRNGLWTEQPLHLPVRVLPIWYQTLWFKMIAALAAAAGVLALVQGRTIILRRRQRDLESLVAERTTELEESKRQVEKLAYHDELTGLANRRLFAENIVALLDQSARRQRRFALLLIDLDKFKQINDTLGHDAGDALLVAAAHRLQMTLRISDRVARLGGDEFAILLDDLTGTQTEQLAIIERVCQRVVDSFAESIPFKAAEMKTSASIGIAIYPNHGSDREELCKSADLALYEAKRNGRNGWRYHVRTPAESPLAAGI